MSVIEVQPPETVGIDSRRLERIEPVLQRYVDTGGYPGFNLMVSRHGKLIYSNQIGYQDREANTPLAEDTIYRIYSMTKPIICTALMTLYEEGAFQLRDPVMKHIPEFASTMIATRQGTLEPQPPLRPMQVRDLLTHTCGLTYDFQEIYPVAEHYRAKGLMNDPTVPLADVIKDLATIPLAFQPGSEWHYGLGTDVAAYLIEVLAGEPVGDYLQRRFFDPLGMVDTGYGVPEEKRGRLSAMYGLPDLFAPNMVFSRLAVEFMAGNIGRKEVQDTYPVDAPDVFQRGGIGLFCTAGDYLRFASMLLTGKAESGERILGRKTLELMHANHLGEELLPYVLGGVPAVGWGFGLGSRVATDIGQLGFPGSVGEFGWSGAAKTYYWVDPVEDLAGVLMTQYMVGFDTPEVDFRTLVYQAIED
jgi:CubicO group peptidase (beta-lactamase class C family)